MDELPPSTRASMNGQVPDTVMYKDWFKTQPEKFQKSVLGKHRWTLWKSGSFSFENYADILSTNI
jgi:hypothetical protein